MALATYALCYNNVNVFRGVVKLRRGEYFVIGIFRKHKLVIALYNPHSFFFFIFLVHKHLCAIIELVIGSNNSFIYKGHACFKKFKFCD
jgi:hypothetical protein